MGFVTLAEAAEALDCTPDAVLQLLHDKVLQPASHVEHAVARREPLSPALRDQPVVDIAGAPKSLTATKVAASIGTTPDVIEGLVLSGRLRRVSAYAPADSRFRIALPLPQLGPEDIALAEKLIAERADAEANAPLPRPLAVDQLEVHAQRLGVPASALDDVLWALVDSPPFVEAFAQRVASTPRTTASIAAVGVGESAAAAPGPSSRARRGRRKEQETGL